MGAGKQARARVSDRAVLIDTDVLVWFLRGNEVARRFLGSVPFDRRRLSVVTRMELMRGCRDRSDVRRLRRFLDGSFERTSQLSEEVSRRADGLVERHALAQQLTVDAALIAATALTERAVLATGNVRDFRFIADLELMPFRAR